MGGYVRVSSFSGRPGDARSAVYTNNTGLVVYGFKITFAAPLRITSHASLFPDQEPQGESPAFEFFGGELPPGRSFWLFRHLAESQVKTSTSPKSVKERERRRLKNR